MTTETRLAEMLCTRLCHDLTGPIGAVNNGAEFLEEEGFEMQHEAMQLILGSASEAVHRLQFYRQAYGKLNDGGEASLAEKKQVVEEFFSGSKVKIDWPDSHAQGANVSISQKMGRLILNAMIVTASSLIRGGGISVRIDENEGAKTIRVVATGETVKMDEELVRVLLGKAQVNTLSPKTVQLVLMRNFAQEISAKLDIQLTDGQLSLTIDQEAMPDQNAA